MKDLVTGAAGFIGFHTTKRLLSDGHEVIGLDNLNHFYEPPLKKARIGQLTKNKNFRFIKADLSDRLAIEEIFRTGSFQRVFHLAAQAGVRHSSHDPHVFAESNIMGFLHILESCRRHNIKHLIYASSSSVYGANAALPFSERHSADHPISFYGATKRANELMAHSYAHLYNLPVTGLRFFTVYGPWGRPDMAPFLFIKAILEEQHINLFNHGKMRRDFTYIDDAVEGIVRASDKIAKPAPMWQPNNPIPSASSAPFKIYNVGSGNPVQLISFVEAIEASVGKKARIKMTPIQAGEVVATHAEISDLIQDLEFKPSTSIQVGVQKFVDWYRDYYKI